jgi:hypothetical protein
MSLEQAAEPAQKGFHLVWIRCSLERKRNECAPGGSLGPVVHGELDEFPVRDADECPVRGAEPCGAKPYVLDRTLDAGDLDVVADCEWTVQNDGDGGEDARESVLSRQSHRQTTIPRPAIIPPTG